MSSIGGDYKGLLQPGFHTMTLPHLHSVLVAPFAAMSIRRPMIFDGLTKFLSELSQAGVIGYAWVNGSFVTEKIDPEDCDLVLCCDGPATDAAPIALQNLLQKQFVTERSQVKVDYLCDVYLRFDYPPTDPRHQQGLALKAYWRGQFGFDRQDNPKGLATIILPVTP